MTNYNDGKWHGWNGGECPVHPETVVEVASETLRPFEMEAMNVNWKHSNDPNLNKIIAFRVIKEHKEPREFWLCGWTICTNREAAERVRDDKHDGLMEIIHVREVLK